MKRLLVMLLAFTALMVGNIPAANALEYGRNCNIYLSPGQSDKGVKICAVMVTGDNTDQWWARAELSKVAGLKRPFAVRGRLTFWSRPASGGGFLVENNFDVDVIMGDQDYVINGSHLGPSEHHCTMKAEFHSALSNQGIVWTQFQDPSFYDVQSDNVTTNPSDCTT